MGTSSRKPAPTGGDWTQAKTRLTNWTKSGGGDDGLSRAALGAFVAALGGAAAAAAGSAGGVRTAAGLGEFLTDVSRDGLDATLDHYGLGDLVGGDPLEALNEIAGRVSGAGNTAEEAAARDALLAILAELFENPQTFEDIEAVAIDEATINTFLARYLSEYIYRRVMQELGSRIADNAASPEQAVTLERSIRDQIRALVALDLSTEDTVALDWQGAAGEQRVRNLLRDAFAMIAAAA